MHERVKWMKHKGKDILYVDLSNINKDEAPRVVEEAERAYLNARKTVILTITNVTNIIIDTDLKNLLNQASTKTKNAGIRIINAMLGITGMQKLIANAMRGKRDTYFAKSEEDAKDWLASYG